MSYLEQIEEEIEYIVYVRKSTDDTSWKQLQSIPDQIEACIKYARNNWFKIKEKPENFEFETSQEIEREDTLFSPANTEIYQKTRHFYIVKEEHTAKIPRKRPKRWKIIKMVNQWKIKWIISYSPDRQARNMVDGWEIIHLAHEWLVDLKYANFSFENNAGGRMMLWVRFVFSKQYSDKLSEDVTRWYNSKITKGITFAKVYYWYKYWNNKMMEVDDRYFSMMQEAFQRKIRDPMKRTDKKIADWLNKSWFRKTNKAWKRSKVTAKKLWEQWIDPVYFGIYVYGNTEVDLRELNSNYEPMIDENDHRLLLRRYREKSYRFTNDVKEENKQIYPFVSWFVVAPDWARATPQIPSKKRYLNKLEELQATQPDAVLSDVIQSHQIQYRIQTKTSEYKGLSIGYDQIEDAYRSFIKWIDISEEKYLMYIQWVKKNAKKETTARNTEKRKLSRMLTITIEERDEYAIGKVWEKDEVQQKVYNKEMKKYADQIEYLKDQIDIIEQSKLNRLVEYDMFVQMLKDIENTFEKWDYVRKGRFIQLLCSNIVLDNKKSLTIRVRPWLEVLFEEWFLDGGRPGIRTRDLGLKRPLL